MKIEKIVLGADHAGIDLKNSIMEYLNEKGYKTEDVGTFTKDSCDYPVFAEKACNVVIEGKADLAILCCGTGIGMSMAANKIKGIRAACCSDTFSARYTRAHNDANVLCMGARVVGAGLACELVDAFVTTEFEGGKHLRRINLIADLENK